jgi:hypothetical protein
MGFVGNVLEKVNGIHWYSIVGLFIFITLFIIIVYRTYKLPKSELLEYKQSILNDEEPFKTNEFNNK